MKFKARVFLFTISFIFTIAFCAVQQNAFAVSTEPKKE